MNFILNEWMNEYSYYLSHCIRTNSNAEIILGDGENESQVPHLSLGETE